MLEEKPTQYTVIGEKDGGSLAETHRCTHAVVLAAVLQHLDADLNWLL
jgi:hypothetical protein